MGNPIPSRDAREAWAKFVNCEDDRYFGNTTRMDKQLAVLARFEAQIRADAYEQAAKVAEDEAATDEADGEIWVARRIADRIRALSDQPDSTMTLALSNHLQTKGNDHAQG